MKTEENFKKGMLVGRRASKVVTAALLVALIILTSVVVIQQRQIADLQANQNPCGNLYFRGPIVSYPWTNSSGISNGIRRAPVFLMEPGSTAEFCIIVYSPPSIAGNLTLRPAIWNFNISSSPIVLTGSALPPSMTLGLGTNVTAEYTLNAKPNMTGMYLVMLSAGTPCSGDALLVAVGYNSSQIISALGKPTAFTCPSAFIVQLKSWVVGVVGASLTYVTAFPAIFG